MGRRARTRLGFVLTAVGGLAIGITAAEAFEAVQPVSHAGRAPAAEAQTVGPRAPAEPGRHGAPEHTVEDDAGPEAPIDLGGRFLGNPDGPRRLALATEPIATIEKGTGGRTLAFKITLEDGTQGYYKPEQRFSGAHWEAEVAAYYLDRELGLGRVPPVVGRRMAWAPLRDAAEGDDRIDEVVVHEDGTVRGAFIWWIPGDLQPIDPGVGWETWIRQRGGLAVTPYQRPRTWERELTHWRATDGHPRARNSVRDAATQAPQTPPEPKLAAALSDMILFDYLTRNIDRWGGNFVNVLRRGDDGPLVFLDNGAAFARGRPRTGLIDAHLHALQRFRRSTVRAIRELEIDEFRERLHTDLLAPVLDSQDLQGLRIRRRHLLEHVDNVVRRFGKDAAMTW